MELKQAKSNRKATFSAKYSEEFPFISSSTVSVHHAFCKPCRSNLNISHGGRSDIVRHCKTNVHINSVKLEAGGKQQTLSFKAKTHDVTEDQSLIRAECLFTKFYIEHNIPLRAADHMGKLLRAAFPNVDEVKKFASSRTKTTHLAKEMAKYEIEKLCKIVRSKPFSIATDGSHTSEDKLYPIVIMFCDENGQEIKHQLLSLPALQSASTGENIGKLVIKELENNDIPVDNCISLGSDNAPVMLGKKNGAIAHLNKINPNIVALGCPCHLINIAAQSAAKALPVSVDQLLIDIYYYLEASVNRKLKLHDFQDLCGTEVQKILRHVCTRWLSLGKCLGRLNKQWPALSLFFESENQKQKPKEQLQPLLKSFTIPKVSDSIAGLSKPSQNKGNKRKICQNDLEIDKNPRPAKAMRSEDNEVSRVTRVDTALKSDLTKAFTCFLEFSISFFEKTNIHLQTKTPLICKLKSILQDFLKSLMLCFLKPAAFSDGKDVRYVDYKAEHLQKEDVDISVGNKTLDILESSIEGKDLVLFYKCVRDYYVRACDYIIGNFPLENEVLKHAEVGDVSKNSCVSFSSIRFFTKKYKVMVLVKDGENFDTAMDKLECEFNTYTTEKFDHEFLQLSSVQQWFALSKFVDSFGAQKFERLAYFMLGLLTIPHSNCECERIFSQVRKNKTDFRGSLSTDMLAGLLIMKSDSTPCYETEFTTDFLKRAKAATKVAVKPE